MKLYAVRLLLIIVDCVYKFSLYNICSFDTLDNSSLIKMPVSIYFRSKWNCLQSRDLSLEL